MKTKKAVKNRFDQKRAAQLQQLSKIGPFVEGSLVGVQHPTCKHVAWRLTFKVKGKTRTVYVPVDMAQEIKEWTREYRRLKTLVRRVTRNSLALIHGHVAARRAANRAQRLRMKTSGGNCSKSSAIVSRK